MRIFFTLLISYCLPSLLPAQQLTGIWRGYFSSNVSMLGDASRDETYKFEIQMLQDNNSLRGVSYSYKTTVFYGKAELTGIYTPGRKTLILKENKLTDLKITGESEACLMTCYLDYSNIGKMQFLEGTFYSVNIRTKADCGSGKIHLEKVKESEFKKEDFLITGSFKKKNENSTALKIPNNPVKLPSTSSGKTNSVSGGKSNANPLVPKKLTPTPESTKSVPPVVEPVTTSSEKTEPAKRNETMAETEKPLKKEPIPTVLLERENELVKTIITDKEEIRIDLYDNGTIDNDTISVYHNNKLVASSQRLNFTPITFRIKSEPGVTHHEIVVVAENLGDIPPNTALMVVTPIGKQRVEIFLSSNEKKNAKVIIDYQPKK
jgi:hypothetical protein